MGILARFGDIISANINELLDKAEDPTKMVDQYLRNATEDFADVKRETAAVIAEEKRCKRLVDEAQAEMNKYTDLAKKALTAGNEADAKVFLGKKQEVEARMAGLTTTYQAAAANSAKMRQMHDKLKADIESLKARRNNVKATMAVAKTQQKVNEASGKMGSAGGAIDAFNRMEERAQSALDIASATADLDAEPEDEATALAAKYGSASSVTVDDELARLKAEMGM